MSPWRKAGFRFYLRHPWQLFLTLLGIALGVAIVTGIDLSLDSANRAFRMSLDAVAGRTTHHIVAGGGLLDEAIYRQLRVAHGFHELSPVVEGYVEVDGRTLQLLGVDPMAERGRHRRFEPAANEVYARLMREPGAVLISKQTALRIGVTPGMPLTVTLGPQSFQLTVIDYLEGTGPADVAMEGLLVADITTAQERLGRLGKLDRIDVDFTDAPAQRLTQLQAALPPSAVVESAEGRNTATLRMTDAFTLNLKSLSFLGLLIGLFIIYNAISFNVLQRRPLLATLRVIGVTRGQLLWAILSEATLLGLVGSALGLALGIQAARGLLFLVTRTIRDVYFVSTVTELLISPTVLLFGIALGVGATLLAAAVPAWSAAGTAPVLVQQRSLLEEKAGRRWPWMVGAGSLALVVAASLLGQADKNLMPALWGQFFLLFGYGLLTPAAVAGLIALAVKLDLSLLPRLALQGLRGSFSRTGVAMAALTLSVAAGIGVGVMVHSFRLAVSDWLEQILQADLYVSLPTSPGRTSDALPADLAAKIRAVSGVATLSSVRRVWIETGLGRSEFLVMNPADPDRPGFRFRATDGRAEWRSFQTRDELFVSEPYANRHGLKVGDSLIVATASGPQSFPITGVLFDYRSDQGIVVMHDHLYRRLWHDEAVSSLGVFLQPDADLEAVRGAIETLFKTEGKGLLIRSNRDIRAVSLDTFDRTFLVTRVLRVMAMAVAFVGILSALLAMQIERAREFAVLRATGLTPEQTARMVYWQTGVLGLFAGLLAWPLGTAIAAALVKVINLRSFGWTMELTLPVSAYLESLLLAVAAALLAGVLPARRIVGAVTAHALRGD